MRTAYLFAPYRMLGLEFSFAWTPHGAWARLLELAPRPMPRGYRRRRKRC